MSATRTDPADAAPGAAATRGGIVARLWQGPLRFWLCLLAAGLCVRGFFDAAIGHGEYDMSYGMGLITIPGGELAFYLWYLVFGVPAALLLAAGLAGTSLPALAERAVAWLLAHRRLFLVGAVVALLGAILAFYRFALVDGAQVADDEATYVFIARTLLAGRVANPSPGDIEFFKSQFVILDGATWYGKYPIGHPLLLALGEALGLRFLVVPLVSCAVLLLTFLVGRRLFGEREAAVGVCLLLLSPQFVFTGATQLSQPAAALCMMLGLWAMLRLREEDRAWLALLAGLGWGFGILVRPMPGVLFLLVAVVAFVAAAPRAEWRARWRRKVALLVVAAIPVMLGCGALIATNRAQTGGALQSGYQAYHGGLERPTNEDGRITVSLAGAALRQNFWLFGWPLSLIFVPFARGRRGLGLFWGLVGAEYAYRLLVPKTVVATTGPIYVLEIVPLLALATASGMVRVKRWLDRAPLPRARAWVVSLALASTAVGATTFLAVQLRNIHRSAALWKAPYQLLAEQGAGRALVFATMMTPMFTSWSYFPPNPSPNLDDDVIFVRVPAKPRQLRKAIEFWQRRFPDRGAWHLFHKGLKPVLARIDARRGPDQLPAAEQRQKRGEDQGGGPPHRGR